MIFAASPIEHDSAFGFSVVFLEELQIGYSRPCSSYSDLLNSLGCHPEGTGTCHRRQSADLWIVTAALRSTGSFVEFICFVLRVRAVAPRSARVLGRAGTSFSSHPIGDRVTSDAPILSLKNSSLQTSVYASQGTDRSPVFSGSFSTERIIKTTLRIVCAQTSLFCRPANCTIDHSGKSYSYTGITAR
jgi:hypothetical protein